MKFSYQILEFDRHRQRSRFARLLGSPVMLEMLAVLADGKVTAKEGREKLFERLQKMELERKKLGYVDFSKKVNQSTFYSCIQWLFENNLIEEGPFKVGGKYVNAYSLKSNFLLFKDEEDKWIPAMLFTCPRKQLILKTSEITEQSLLENLPDSNLCAFCPEKKECKLYPSLVKFSRFKKAGRISVEGSKNIKKSKP